jgi:hypothetical protein
MVLLCLFWGEAFVLGIPLNVNGLSYGVVPGSGRAGVRLFLPNSKHSNHSKLAGERIARADARLAIFIEQPHAIRRGSMMRLRGSTGRDASRFWLPREASLGQELVYGSKRFRVVRIRIKALVEFLGGLPQ